MDKTIISEDSSENLIDDSSDFHLAAEIFIGRWMNIDVADGFSVSFWLRIKHVDVKIQFFWKKTILRKIISK